MTNTVKSLSFVLLASYKVIADEMCPVCNEALDETDYKLGCGHQYHAHCIYNAYSRNYNHCSLCNRAITNDDLENIYKEVLEKIMLLLTIMSQPIAVLENYDRIRNIIVINRQNLQLALDQEHNERVIREQNLHIQREREQLQENINAQQRNHRERLCIEIVVCGAFLTCCIALIVYNFL